MDSEVWTRTVRVPNVSCQHCVHTIRMELGDLPGVVSVDVEVPTKLVTVTWKSPATWEQVTQLLAEIGYPVAEG